MKIAFWKSEAVSNDFVLVHAGDVSGINLEALAISMCDRHVGIGADGLLVVDDHLRLRMFNSDGSEDFCGNGIRCAADHLKMIGAVTDEFEIEHGGQQIPVTISADGVVTIQLGSPSFDPAIVPLDVERFRSGLIDEPILGYVGTAISTGSTHFVIIRSELPEDDEFFGVSPQIEHDAAFPERTSVIWAKPEGHVIQLRIWERGVGETKGCGTGSAAAATVVARQSGHYGLYEVRSKGGTIQVGVPEDLKHVSLASTVDRVFSGQYLASVRCLATN